MQVNMKDSKGARIGTLCAMYFSQGVPWFFVATALVTFLVDEGQMTDDEKVLLIGMGMLPWIVGKLLLGPMIDRFQFKSMGKRRPWVMISQLGMIATVAAFLLIDEPGDDLKTLGIFFLIHNIFAALQDVASDALAVEVLHEEEIPMANGLMFVAKGLGAMFAVLVLGRVLLNSGFETALLVQLPVLFVMLLVPILVKESSDNKRFPWSEGTSTGQENDSEQMKFGEIISGFRTAVSDKSAKWALILCTVMWIGGGMGTGFGIIDFQWEFLFVEELDWDAQKFLDTKGVPIFLCTMLGFLVGGFLGTKYGSRNTLLYAIVTGTVLTVIWSAARGQWDNDSFMLAAWMFWTFVWAIVGANLLALLMSLTTKDLGGTQFSIYMTLINAGAFIGNALSPRILDAVDGNFPNLFLVGAAFQAIVIWVILKIKPEEIPTSVEVNLSEE